LNGLAQISAQGIGPVDLLGRVTMQVFVRGYRMMVAASVQCDVDGIPERSHYLLLKRTARSGAASRTSVELLVRP
jgi:hypothetical protein